jgi:hypothetical protein
MCNPVAEAHYRDYISTDTGVCSLIDYVCPDFTTMFGNECGCGCEQGMECPDTFDCPADGSADMMCATLRERCPYTELVVR